MPLQHLQAVTTPDPFYPVLADVSAIALRQRRDPAVAVTSLAD
jgi:hypothetical protein